MTNKIAVIHFGSGVSVNLPYSTEPKHFSDKESDVVMENLAKRLGGELQYTMIDELSEKVTK